MKMLQQIASVQRQKLAVNTVARYRLSDAAAEIVYAVNDINNFGSFSGKLSTLSITV